MKALPFEVECFARNFYRAIGTELSSQLLKWLDDKQWDLIANATVSPKDYTDSQSYFLDASACGLLKKCRYLPTSLVQRRIRTLENWRLGEVDCYKTNERLAPYLEGLTHPLCDERILSHIEKIREKISTVLGRAPAMDHLSPRHGPGSTFADKSKESTVAHKMQSEPTITPQSVWFLLDWIGTAWGREALNDGRSPAPVRGNRFGVADKDATKLRPLAIEPSINIFYQLGVGTELRSRLKNAGIHLDVAADAHRAKAQESSISGSTATLDLSNASDTVSYNLVKLLLPADWFQLLVELRCSHTWFDEKDAAVAFCWQPDCSGRWYRLEKFSSMGNGFTFELETLLFWALADYASAQDCGDSREQTLVFGDDIICDSRGVEAVTSVLRFFGMSLNERKSFVGGPFKESCGGDFWAGRPVRPFFLKEPLDEPQQLIAAANGVSRLAEDLFGGFGALVTPWHNLLTQLPSHIRRCRGPKGLGDIVIHDDEDRWGWTSSSMNKIWAYTPIEHRTVSLLKGFSPGTVLACGLYGILVSSGIIIPRDSVSGYGLRRVYPNKCTWLPFITIRRGEAPVTITFLGASGPKYDDLTRVIKRNAS